MDLAKLESLLTRVEKPSQYLGGEFNVIKKDFDKAAVRVALVFPDKYEVGASHIGLKILYDILNAMPDVVAERAYAPGLDMEAELKKENLPLFSLESKRPLSDFDIIGVSLTYELTYTNMLSVLDLANIPLWQKDRTNEPLIIAGGGCTMNAEPVADFLDAACLGDGEEIIVDVVHAVHAFKKEKVTNRKEKLRALSKIEGVYIPSFFNAEYNTDGTLKQMTPLLEGYTKINKRVVQNMDAAPYPTKWLVPSVKPIHDRIGIEIQRGCNRACRFCQAGYIDRPVRQRSPERILQIAEDSLNNTGMEEMSLLSLSAADYACIVPLMEELNGRYAKKKISISVPATRTEKLTPELADQIKKVRKTGFTIAPEAATERMRRVINKGNKVDDLYKAVHTAFSKGWDLLKLYYMVGLPFETDEDNKAIAAETNEAIKICLSYTKRAELNLSSSSFVPKPHTPFQWEPQMTIEETKRRYDLVKHNLASKRIRFKSHHPQMSYIEGLLSRGDRRVAQAIYLAYQEGCRFDEWEEHFSFEKWQAALSKWDGDISFYLHRARKKDEVLPWDHLFSQMDKEFLWQEYEKAHDAAMTHDWTGTMSQHHHLADGTKKEQDVGFTEDCSIARCSDCGVCDFRKIKNRIFVVGQEEIVVKKGNREAYGWMRTTGTVTDLRLPDPEPRIPCRLRSQFSKIGSARFMGHLEMVGVIKRAIKRARIPIKYSEGFHPQMRIMPGHPLPLGVSSTCEFFDVELKDTVLPGDFMEKMNSELPEGLFITHCETIDSKTPSLYSSASRVGYRVRYIDTQVTWGEKELEKLTSFKEAQDFIWKRVKRDSVKEFNLKNEVSIETKSFPQGIQSIQEFDFFIRVNLEGSLSPSDVLRALLGLSEEELSRVWIEKIVVERHQTGSQHIEGLRDLSQTTPAAIN
ncbi:TIGR03960 family B12-binding radical SAM protein [bacterium]|nr:TIGR03960 family B12-binding radical SAM protein [bacterium]